MADADQLLTDSTLENDLVLEQRGVATCSDLVGVGFQPEPECSRQIPLGKITRSGGLCFFDRRKDLRRGQGFHVRLAVILGRARPPVD